MTLTAFTHMHRPVFSGREAADYLGLSYGTLEVWRRQGRGPRYVRLGRRIGYRHQDIEAFLDLCAVEARTS
jgi:predicted DNA-binding transcriptional regulator AlpA